MRFTTLLIIAVVAGLIRLAGVATLAAAEIQPNIILIMVDDKCDGLGAMAAKEAEIPEKLASRPHRRITLNYVGFLWIQGS